MSVYVIAVDFDGTLCEDQHPKIGKPNMEMIDYIKRRQQDGAKIVLWTCRINELLDDAIRWSRNQGLIFDAVNENIPELITEFGTDTRKIFANEYIDDRNVPMAACRGKSNMQSWAETMSCEKIQKPWRLCKVKGKVGYFHAWESYSKPIEASPLIGGAPAGIFSITFGIVEFADGVRRVDPTDIHFCDEENRILSEIMKGETR